MSNEKIPLDSDDRANLSGPGRWEESYGLWQKDMDTLVAHNIVLLKHKHLHS